MLKIDFDNNPFKAAHRNRRKVYRHYVRTFGNSDGNRDIIKSSGKIRDLLLSRFNELDKKPSDIIKDAKKRNLKLNKSGYSRYFNGIFNEGNILTQYQILWLCIRWGVSIKFKAESMDYDEKKCLQQLDKLNQVK